jgi:hypothetical protein
MMSETVRIWMWALLFLQIVALALAIRVCLARRTLPFALLVTAFVCQVVSASLAFTWNFTAGSHPPAASLVLFRRCVFGAGRVSGTFFSIFLILALIAFLRERSTMSTPPV